MTDVTYAQRLQMAVVMLKSGLADVPEVAGRLDLSTSAVERLVDQHCIQGLRDSRSSAVRSLWQA